ncbi:di-trans,poly-cis-decaprenylcistransferase [Candidatus Woesearchaeota archaeon]|nr:di-trans,poly-cis-decaprenylcistransferase [Candidatus Woesearchaeota archaeon]
MEPSNNSIPKHVGIIVDGNRRFAKRLMMKPWKGHEWGYEKIKKLFDWSKELGIQELTLYTFSIENFKRPKEEFDYLMDLCERAFKETKKDKRIHKNKVRISFIGRTFMFPEKVQKAMHELQETTKNYSDFIVNFAMAYGGRAEIIDATRKIAAQVKEGKLDIDSINEEVFRKNIYLESEPDLIIRTSGEKRLSGFLLWQGSYAEIYWCEKLWPEFEKEDFVAAIQDYSKRQRRFGK